MASACWWWISRCASSVSAARWGGGESRPLTSSTTLWTSGGGHRLTLVADRALAHNRVRCAGAVAASGTTLTTVFGISDVLAAKILGHTGDVSRFSSADRFASYTGTAPVEASSGEVTRHRLSRNGNRSLNNALHLAARVQIMHPGPGREHYERKLAEHKSSGEALRASLVEYRIACGARQPCHPS